MSEPSALLLDIETTPNISYTWGLRRQEIAPCQIKEPSTLLCWAAKWYGQSDVEFARLYGKKEHQRLAALHAIHALMDEADALVHYNGASFDVPRLNQEFLKAGLKPPSPSKQIDLYLVVSRKFSLPSNKLEFVAPYFGVGKKVKHPGMELWLDCMKGKRKAWALMREYNEQDTKILEGLYEKLLPWIDRSLNRSIEGVRCINCGSNHLQRRGIAVAVTRTYQRYQCKTCGKWQRSTKSERQSKASLTDTA